MEDIDILKALLSGNHLNDKEIKQALKLIVVLMLALENRRDKQ